MTIQKSERDKKIEMAVRLLRLAGGEDNSGADRSGERAAAQAQAQKIIEKYGITQQELNIGLNTDYEKVQESTAEMGHYAEYVFGFDRWGEIEGKRPKNAFAGSAYDFSSDISRTDNAKEYYGKNPLKEPQTGALWAPDMDAVVSDPNLMAAVNRALGRESGEIHPDELIGLTRLDASGMSIRALDGLEWAKNLKKLDISRNPVSDILPLENMLSLTEVNLEGTDVWDLSPLSRCRKLRRINISHTPVRSAKPLGVLLFAEHIKAKGTQIGDLPEVRKKIRQKKYRSLF